MTTKATRKRGLTGKKAGVTVQPSKGLAERIQADRIARRMTWPEYAEFMSVGGKKLAMSTLHKIATGATPRPQALTVAQIEERLAVPVKREPTAAEGAAREVVSSGQRHPERPED